MPAQNQFSGIGILDGQIVEANHVSQSVDAFTALKDYDIIISGSLTVTGSINLSGSLVNEYTGQFKTLGIGTPAPTGDDIMLHVKSDLNNGFDPIVLIEGKGDTDNAIVRLKNPTVEYDIGELFSSDFSITQDRNGTPSTPFKIDYGAEDYTLYLAANSVGVGMGANTPSKLANLPIGSLQVQQLITSSVLRANTISASATTGGPAGSLGENIHGTASYATYVETSQTASYIKSTNIDFAYSISQQINSNGTIVATTGSFNHLKLDDNSGAALKNVSNANYTRFISGSTETNQGALWLGNMESGGTMIEINNEFDHIKLYADKTFMTGDAVVGDDLFISGSVTPSLIVGPAAAQGTINSPSSSLFANSLEFNRNDVAYIGNFNTAATSKVQLSAGGGGNSSKMAMELSSSKDTKLSGSLNMMGGPTPTNHYDLISFWDLGRTTSTLNASGRSGYYKMRPFNTNNSSANVFGITFGNYFGNNANVNWKLSTNTGQNKFIFHAKMCVLGTPSNANGVYLEREFLVQWAGSNLAGGMSILNTGTLTRINSNSVYNSSTILGAVENTLGNSFSLMIDVNTSTSTDWVGWCETKRVGDFYPI